MLSYTNSWLHFFLWLMVKWNVQDLETSIRASALSFEECSIKLKLQCYFLMTYLRMVHNTEGLSPASIYWSTNTIIYYCLMTSFGLRSDFSLYVRELNGSRTHIDNMFTNFSGSHINFSMIGVSDNHGQIGDVVCNVPPKRSSIKFQICRKITTNNITFKFLMVNKTWDAVFNANSLILNLIIFVNRLFWYFFSV